MNREVTTAKRLLTGAIWGYASQLASVLIQFGYAAVTTRLVDDTGFGAYGVALAAAGLFTLLTTGGLSQTVGRVHELSQRVVSPIFTYSLILAAIGAGVTIALAYPWSYLWNSPESVPVILVISINSATAPVYGLITGVLLRQRRFGTLAVLTFGTNVTGMAFGILAVLAWANAVSLVVSAVISQALFTAIGVVLIRNLLGIARHSAGDESRGFSIRLVSAQFLQYLIGNIGRWATSFSLGPAPLGQWNRAEVVAVIPIQQLQGAIIPVIYPEFRHDRAGSSRARTLWPDLLGAMAWITVPLGCVAAVVLPLAIPFLFGSGWRSAGLYAIPLAVAAGIQPVSVLIASAIEALGEFKIVWTVNAIVLGVQVALAVAVAASHSVWPAIFGPMAANAIAHGLYCWWARSRGRLDVRRLLVHYVRVGAASLALAAVSFCVLYGLVFNVPLMSLSGAAGALVLCAIAAIRRNRLAPLMLVAELGLWGSSRVASGLGRSSGK